jgi:phage/plasmid primase-like uncharacterized protein
VIRLTEPEPGKPLVIGEGPETSTSAGLLRGAPAWAALSSGNLAHNLSLPPEVIHVIIAVDPDDPGEKAAREAGNRWRDGLRRVQLMRPPPGFGDFNDVLCAMKRGIGK